MPSREIRKLDPAHVREVAKAISTLGFCAPVLVGKGNSVTPPRCAGRGGSAARPRPRPVRADRAPERDRAARLRLAVGRLGEKGEWNLDELKIEFEELIVADAPIEASGFALDEIDHIVLGEVDDAVEEGPLSPEADFSKTG